MARKKPTFAQLLGFGGVIAGGDFTGNEEFKPSGVPPRTKLPGRGRPEDSFDKFSPEADAFDYDFSEDYDDDAHAVLSEEEDRPDVFLDSKTELDKNCPSISNPKRFSF